VEVQARCTLLDEIDNGSEGGATCIVRQPTKPCSKFKDKRPCLEVVDHRVAVGVDEPKHRGGTVTCGRQQLGQLPDADDRIERYLCLVAGSSTLNGTSAWCRSATSLSTEHARRHARPGTAVPGRGPRTERARRTTVYAGCPLRQNGGSEPRQASDTRR